MDYINLAMYYMLFYLMTVSISIINQNVFLLIFLEGEFVLLETD